MWLFFLLLFKKNTIIAGSLKARRRDFDFWPRPTLGINRLMNLFFYILQFHGPTFKSVSRESRWRHFRTCPTCWHHSRRLSFHLPDHFTSISPWHQLRTSRNPAVGACASQGTANTLITCQVCTGMTDKELQQHQAFFWSAKHKLRKQFCLQNVCWLGISIVLFVPLTETTYSISHPMCSD